MLISITCGFKVTELIVLTGCNSYNILNSTSNFYANLVSDKRNHKTVEYTHRVSDNYSNKELQ